MKRIERHDGALLAPCPHCGKKPQHVTHNPGSTNTTHQLECTDFYCGLSTGTHDTFEDAKQEWEQLSIEWDNSHH